MTASIETVRTLVENAGINLYGAVTLSEMKRVVLHHYDVRHRAEYAAGRRLMITRADYNLLEALEISSFRSLFAENYTSP
jgi:hypothetical protein